MIDWASMTPRETWEAKRQAPKLVVGPWTELEDKSGSVRFDENGKVIVIEFGYMTRAGDVAKPAIRVMIPDTETMRASTRADADGMLKAAGYLVVDPAGEAR